MKRAFTIWELVIVLGVLLVLAAILYPIFAPNHEPPRGYYCISQLKQIVLSCKQYTQDYEGKFLPVTLTQREYGWADSVHTYVNSTQVLQCPAEESSQQKPVNPRATGYTDYWFNARLSGIVDRRVISPANIIIMGDGNDGMDVTDACYALRSLPLRWIGDSASPLYRHKGGANFAFVDGHVKNVPGERITSPSRFGNYTFVPK